MMESGVEFVAADMPFANKLTIHILAAVAEYEREAISERTKAALAAAKARGTRLGAPIWQQRASVWRGSKGQDGAICSERPPDHSRDTGRRPQNAGSDCSTAKRPQDRHRADSLWTHVQVRRILKASA